MASDRRIAPADTASPGFGRRLRAARELRGITLQEISQSTKIPVAMLDALENEKTSRLPGGIFSRAFVRSFATAVGLDPEEALADFQRAFPDDGVTDDRRVDDAPLRPDGRLWPLLLLLVGVVLALTAATAWYRGYGPDLRSVWQRIQGPPQATLGGGDQVAPSQPAAAESRPASPSAPVATAPEPSSAQEAASAGDTASRPASDADAKADDQAPAPGPVAVPRADGLVRLSIRPTGPCWVKVTADGAVRLSRLVAAGEKVDFAAAARLQVEVGDAGAFAYSIDGRPGRSLGAPGRVARVTIDASTSDEFVAR